MIDIREKKQAKDLQEFLLKYKYDLGKYGADGDFKKISLKALDEMVRDIKNPPVIGNSYQTKDDLNSIESRIQFIINGCKEFDFTDTQTAYVLATVKRETGNTFKPVREAYYINNNFEIAEDWRKKHLRYYPWYGKGYVQITWKQNYEKFSKITGKDLVNNPDLALEPEISRFILCYGFKHGTFTGKKISDYINSTNTDFYNARRCINGTDHAREIAKDAEMYLKKYFRGN